MAVIAKDTFAGVTDGVTIAGRAAQAGGTWGNVAGSYFGAPNNKVRNNGSPGIVVLDGNVAVDTYRISVKAWVSLDNNANGQGVMAYYSTATQNYFHARINTNGNSAQLYKFTALSTAALLASAPIEGFAGSQAHEVGLEVSPGQQKLILNGVVTDTTADGMAAPPTAEHRVGLRGTGTSGSATGLHLYDFLADDLVTGPTPVDSNLRTSLWSIKAWVDNNRTSNWSINETVTKEGTGDIDTPFTSGWNVSADVNVPRSSMWNVAAEATQAQVSSWNVYATVPVSEVTSGLHTSLWAVIGRVEESRLGLWTVNQAADVELTSLWEVRSEVLQQLLTEWQTFESTEQGLAATWSVLGSIDLELATEWSIFSASASYDERHFLPPLVAVVFDAVSAGIVSDAVALGNVVDHEATGTPANYEATGTNV